METLTIRRWKLQSDPDATRNAFFNRELGSPESCGCADCLNFAAARERAYPAEVLTVFNQLGIDSHKESEIWHRLTLGEIDQSLDRSADGAYFNFIVWKRRCC